MFGESGSPWRTPLLILDKYVKTDYSYVKLDMLNAMMQVHHRHSKVASISINYLYVAHALKIQ